MTSITPPNLIGSLVERMTDQPPNCMFCGCGNTPDETGDIGPFLSTRLDRSWGDSCYICGPCGMSIGALFDMLTPDEVQPLHRLIRNHEKKIHDLEAELQRGKRAHRATRQRLDAALVTKAELRARKRSTTASPSKAALKSAESTAKSTNDKTKVTA